MFMLFIMFDVCVVWLFVFYVMLECLIMMFFVGVCGMLVFIGWI